MKVEIAPAALEEVTEAAAWYDARQVVAFAHHRRRPRYWRARLQRS